MRLNIVVLVVLLGSALSSEDYEDFEKEEVELGVEYNEAMLQESIRTRFLHSKQCSGPANNWKCKQGCYDHFTNISGPLPNKCKVPSPGDTCFGQPLLYAHIRASEHFPIHYQALQNYPKCWSHLAPLMCAVHYRPCAKQQAGLPAGDIHNKTMIPAVVEMWAKIRRGYCLEARRVCNDAIENGYFPDFVDCDIFIQTNHTNLNTKNVFSDNCPISSLPASFNFYPRCPQPLIYIDVKVKGATPVIDSCYLKCRGDHIDKESLKYQHVYQITFGGSLTLIFLAAWFYLHFFSVAQKKSVIVFCASQSFISMAIWTGIWTLGPIIYHESDCVEVNGIWLRRTEKATEFLHLCVTQSVLMNFGFAARFLWLMVIAYLGLNYPVWLRESEKTTFGLTMRPILVFGVYGISAFFAIVFQQFNLHETDGVSGVCVAGLYSSYHYLVLISIPFFCTFGILLSLYLYRNAIRYFEKAALYDTKEFVRKVYDWETSRRKRYCAFKEIKDPTPNDLKAVTEEELKDAEDDEDIEFPEDEPLREKIDHVAAKCDNEEGGLVHRLLLRYDHHEQRQLYREGLPDSLGDDLWRDILDNATLHFVAKFLTHYRRHRHNFVEGFGFNWLLAMSVIAIIVVWVSIPLHFLFINNDSNFEKLFVRNYINCGLNSSIVQKHTEWVHTGDPEGAFLHCTLNSYLPHQRASYVIFFFILLPTAPFLVLITAMVAGFCQTGGMKTIRQVKWTANGMNVALKNHLEENVELVEIPKKKCRTPSEHSVEEVRGREVTPRLSPNRPLLDQPRIGAPAQQSALSSSQNGSLSIENSLPSVTAPSQPPSVGRVPVRVKGIDATEKVDTGEVRPNVLAGNNRRNLTDEDHLSILAARLQAFIENYGSATQGMNPMPPLKDANILAEELRAAARRERVLNQQHHIAMEAMRDLSAFVNYNAERLRLDAEMWNLITTTLNNLASVASELFPIQTTPEGLQVRVVAPEYSRLYESLLGIGQILTTINPHLREFEDWRNVTTQASELIRNSMFAIRNRARMPQQSGQIHNGQAPKSNDQQACSSSSQVATRPIANGQRVPNLLAPQGQGPSNQPIQNHILNGQSNRQVNGHANGQVNGQVNVQVNGQVNGQGNEQGSVQGSVQAADPGQQTRRCAMVPRSISPDTFTHNRHQNQGSAYMETYSAAPNGFYTRFNTQELRLRITRMAEIHGPISFPQELIYALIMTGDIRLAGNDVPDEGERTVLPSEYPSLFGRAVPIDVVTPPREFLMAMRRRAIIFVITLGFDYNTRGRNSDGRYMPPTFPDLGMTSMNELLLVRIFSTENLVRMKSMLAKLMSKSFVEYSPQIPEVAGFAAYLDAFATNRGFPHQREEWVHDPEQPSESFYLPTPVSSSVENEEQKEAQKNEQEEKQDEDEIDKPGPSGLQNNPELPSVADHAEEEKENIKEDQQEGKGDQPGAFKRKKKKK